MNRIDIAAGARLIRQGAVVAYPTEACFGIGCDPLDRSAVLRIARIKHRPRGMSMILIADCVEKLLPYIALRNESVLDDPLASWPGPYTWILPASSRMPASLQVASNTVAVRVTAHAGAAHLSRAAGRAIVSTSANRHGQAPIREYGRILRCLGSAVDFVVRGPLGGQRNPTQIKDAVSGRVLRSS